LPGRGWSGRLPLIVMVPEASAGQGDGSPIAFTSVTASSKP